MSLSTTAAIAEEIRNNLATVKAGSMRFYGHWFGKPYDNVHFIEACYTDGNVLVVEFDGNEKLSVWEPSGLKISADIFEIKSAARVKWEWYYYGRPQLPENLFYIQCDDMNGAVKVSSNSNWFHISETADARLAAVEIL